MSNVESSLEASEHKISVTIWIDVSSSVFGQCSSILSNKQTKLDLKKKQQIYYSSG